MSQVPNSDIRHRGGSCIGAIVAMSAVLISGLFLANLTFGVVEIPDNLPLVGNIDEVFATAVLVSALSRFGIHLAPNLDPKQKQR